MTTQALSHSFAIISTSVAEITKISLYVHSLKAKKRENLIQPAFQLM